MKRIFMAGAALASLSVSVAGASARPATQAAHKQLSSADRKWLKEAKQGELKEIALGKLVSTRAAHPSVRAFARRMLQDHTKADAQLSKLARAKGVTLPRGMGAKNQETYNHLAHLPSARLDHDYIANMVVDHVGDVSTFRKEAVHGSDRDVKVWATKTIPVLRQHLTLAKSTAHQIGATQINSKKPEA